MFAEKLVEIKYPYTLSLCTNSLASRKFLSTGMHFTIRCAQEILDHYFTKGVGNQILRSDWSQSIDLLTKRHESTYDNEGKWHT